MFKYPDPFITATSGTRTLMCKTFQVKYTDEYLSYRGTPNNVFGWNPQNAQGNAVGLKAILPADATIVGMALYNNAASNTGGTTPAGNLAIGRSIPFVSLSAAGTTLTVKCQYAHGLTASDVVHITDTGVANFNTVTSTTVNGITTNTTQNKVPLTVTPSSTDPTVFTVTIPSTTATSTQGMVICTSYYAYPVVATGVSGVIGTGFQWMPTLKNVGSFAATTPSGYWAVAPSAVLGYVTTPGTPAVWSVSGALSALLGNDGNYNYFIEPGLDAQIFGIYQESAASGFVAATSGGPWTVFIYYFR